MTLARLPQTFGRAKLLECVQSSRLRGATERRFGAAAAGALDLLAVSMQWELRQPRERRSTASGARNSCRFNMTHYLVIEYTGACHTDAA